MKVIDDRINLLKGYIYRGEKIKGEKTPALELFDKIMNKIMNVYSNKDIHSKIKKYFKNEGVKLFEKYEKTSFDFFNYLNTLDKIITNHPHDKLNATYTGYGLEIRKVVDEYLPTMFKYILDIDDCVGDIGVFIIDIFFFCEDF